METDRRINITTRELIIDMVGLSSSDIEKNYIGDFLCEARNGYSYAEAKAAFKYGKGGGYFDRFTP